MQNFIKLSACILLSLMIGVGAWSFLKTVTVSQSFTVEKENPARAKTYTFSALYFSETECLVGAGIVTLIVGGILAFIALPRKSTAAVEAPERKSKLVTFLSRSDETGSSRDAGPFKQEQSGFSEPLSAPASYYGEIRNFEKEHGRSPTSEERRGISEREDKAARGPDGERDEADWHGY